MKTILFISNFMLIFFISNAQKVYKTKILVIGGGTAGIASGLQASRLHVPTMVVEESHWLGGMLTAAGVSAVDGNYQLPAGIFGEFVNHLYNYYGGKNKTSTGWVSNICFEPYIGDSILKSISNKEKYLTIQYNAVFKDLIFENKKIIGANFFDKSNQQIFTVYAEQFIDATELGDVISQTNIQYDIGMEADSITHENMQIPASNNYIQDLTYTAILKDYGKGKNFTIRKPTNFDENEFNGACAEFDSLIEKKSTLPCNKMLDYTKLPNNKYLLNWPNNGNDIYLNFIEKDRDERNKEIEKAKQKTLRFIYFIQNTLGFNNLGLYNEFNTKDSLAIIPYYRESKRIKGLVRFNLNHILKPFNQKEKLYRTGIGVGDYPIDHHHKKNPHVTEKLFFYPIPSFNIPIGILIPTEKINLIVVEKSVSVSNIVNGTTRLQPCVMQIGQAGGIIAALCVQQNKLAHNVSVREVQKILLENKGYLMPYIDIPTTNPHFITVQKSASTGLLRGVGAPYKWANRTYFYPDSFVLLKGFIENLQELISIPINKNVGSTKQITLEDIIYLNTLLPKKYSNFNPINEVVWASLHLNNFNLKRPLNKLEVAVIVEYQWNLFNKIEIDWTGNPILEVDNF